MLNLGRGNRQALYFAHYYANRDKLAECSYLHFEENYGTLKSFLSKIVAVKFSKVA